jgi:photosystem II stability/assembly factor-like uncharacterized protein
LSGIFSYFLLGQTNARRFMKKSYLLILTTVFLLATAAGAAAQSGPSISGRVSTADGRAINRAAVTISGGSLSQPVSTLTNNFGNYSFGDLESGRTYTLSVQAKGHTFSQSSVNVALGGDAANADFTADSQIDAWRWQNPLPQGNDLRGVWFVDAGNGWAVGDFGTILRTNDGGQNWTIRKSGVTQILWDVAFFNTDLGIAVGAGGTILRTTDGGENWTAQTSGTISQLRAVSFIDANTGWIVGEGGLILHTTDGGNNWTPQTSGTFNTLLGVTFTDANNGTAVGQLGTVLRTGDGGQTWTVQRTGTDRDFYSASFTDAGTGTVVGAYGAILRTENGTSQRIPETDSRSASNKLKNNQIN